MEPLKKLSRQDYYRILMTCGGMILLASLELLAKAKDITYFNALNSALLTQGRAVISYSDFVVSLMAAYLGRIILPVGLGLNAYFAFLKSGYNGVFVWSWGIFTLAALLFHILALELTSSFYYLFIILYLSILFLLFRLARN